MAKEKVILAYSGGLDTTAMIPWLKDFSSDSEKHTFLYTVGDGNAEDERIYNAELSYLYDGQRKRGYIVMLTDDTQNRKYISLLDHYNEDLQKTVQEKTQEAETTPKA